MLVPMHFLSLERMSACAKAGNYADYWDEPQLVPLTCTIKMWTCPAVVQPLAQQSDPRKRSFDFLADTKTLGLSTGRNRHQRANSVSLVCSSTRTIYISYSRVPDTGNLPRQAGKITQTEENTTKKGVSKAGKRHITAIRERGSYKGRIHCSAFGGGE